MKCYVFGTIEEIAEFSKKYNYISETDIKTNIDGRDYKVLYYTLKGDVYKGWCIVREKCNLNCSHYYNEGCSFYDNEIPKVYMSRKLKLERLLR